MENKSSSFVWVIGALVIGAAIIVLGVVTGGNGDQVAGVYSSVDKVEATDWVRGNPSSGVALIEYSDFECPACAAYYTVVRDLESQYGDRVAFAYRHFPLRTVHEKADLAAKAAEAAGEQGMFWEMHDKLFEDREAWINSDDTAAVFTGYAETLGLDTQLFVDALNSEEIAAKVDESYRGAIAAGLDSTPTFFLNGEKILPQSGDEFTALIEAALAGTSTSTPTETTTPAETTTPTQ